MEQNRMTPRPVSASRAEHTQILLAEHLNGSGRLFGGRLMEWIDITAGVAARRHSGCNVTTASIDTLHFKSPAFVNDTVVLLAKVTYVGRTSMEVRVDTFVEALSGERRVINTAYLVLVAPNAAGKLRSRRQTLLMNIAEETIQLAQAGIPLDDILTTVKSAYNKAVQGGSL